MVAATVVAATSQGSGGGKYTSEEGSECGSSVTSESMPGGLHMSPRHNAVGTSSGLESFFQELQERREEVERLREEMEHVKVSEVLDNSSGLHVIHGLPWAAMIFRFISNKRCLLLLPRCKRSVSE